MAMSTTRTANTNAITQAIVQNSDRNPNTQLIHNNNNVSIIHNQQHIAPNNVMIDNNMNNKSIANNCNIQLNNLLTLPLNNGSPLYLFDHNILRNSSNNNNMTTMTAINANSLHKIANNTNNRNNNTSSNSRCNTNSLNSIREGNTPSPLTLSAMSNNLNDNSSNTYSISKPSRTSDGLISGLNFSHTDILREGGFMSYQTSPATPTSTPSSFMTSSLDGYLTGGQGGPHSNQSFDLLDSDSFSEMPNSLSPSCQPTYDDNSGHSYGESKKQCNESTSTPSKKKRKSGPQVRPSCPDCGKEFSNQSALSKHKLTHSDERKFVCTQCAKAFKRQDHLNGHLLTHRSKKPYECDVEGCEKTYCDARSLRRHKENHHPGGVNPIVSTTLPAVTIIPGIALNFSANTSSISIANPTINKIKYAPPPPPVSAPIAVTSVSSAATQLKLLALQQDNVNTINTINTSSGKWNHRSNDELSDKWNQQMEVDKNALRHNNANECKIKHETAILAQDSHENALLHQLLTQQQFKERQPLFTAHNSLQMQSQQRSQSNLNQSQPQPQHPSSHPSSLAMVQSQQEWPYTMFAQSTSNKSEPQQVECSLCQRKFKNVPALNGHMRLHGGYLKNQSQNIPNSTVNAKKENKVDNSQMKAIVDVIKERIFRKHASNVSQSQPQPHAHTHSTLPPLITHSTSSLTMPTTSASHQQIQSPIQPSLAPPILSPVTPVTPIQPGVTTSFNYDFSSDQNNDTQYNRSDQEFTYSNELQLLREQLQFRIPSQPIASPNQNRFQQQDKQQSHSHSHSRRHSDSSDLIVNNNIANNVKVLESDEYSSNDCYNTQFNDLLRRRTQRTCSDPGVEPVMTINTNYHSPQPQMYNQFYHHSHSVPTTPTALYHSASNALQPQSYPHSLPSTPTAPSAPVSFQHSPHSAQRTSLPSTPTDAQQHFNFISVSSPANVASVKSHYSASPSSVAQYSPSNTQYSPLPAATQQFTYTVQPPTTRATVVYERRIQDTYQQSAMYDDISNYTNTVNVNSNSLNNEHFNFDNSMAGAHNYYESTNSIIANEANQMHISNQQIEQLSLNTLSPKPQSQQQFFDNFSSTTTSHDYPIVTTSNYVQSTNCWQQTPNRVDLTVKDMLHTNANNTSTSTPLVSNASDSIVSITSDNTRYPVSVSVSLPNPTFVSSSAVQSTLSPNSRNTHTLKSSSPNLAVNLDKIDEVDEECDDVFLSPIGVAPSPKRSSPSITSGVVSPKRAKHRPEPLYIPPHVNTCGYQSRLRSPRLWDPTAVADSKNLSPPPYTPPPMLSPVRSGPGLFWHIISGSMTPKSGTITPKFVYSRKSWSEKEKEKEENTSLIVNTTPTTAYEPFDCEIPETDIQPHVNIGPSFQARIPAFNNNREQVKYRSDKADLIWDPTIVEPLTDEDIESFLELSCCACVPGSGRNKEYALHLLFMTKGDVHNAITKLLEPHPTINEGHPLVDYQYPENDFWVQKEIESYHSALSKCDKDFFSIAKEVGTKSVKQCIQFYYMWKKVCPDEYRRLRTVRRKREQETIFYNLRSKEEENNNNNNISAQTLKEDTDFDAENNNDTETLGLVNNSGHSSDVDDNLSSLIDSANPSPATSVGSVAVVEYPCKLCGKVFHKVKSRSAHMKIHGSSGSAKY